MSKWNVGMKDEKDRRITLPDGIYAAEIVKVVLISEEKSKSGNPYFKWSLGFPAGEIEVVTTLLKGKRWLLKQMLSACGIEAKKDDPDQKYSFDEEDVIGKLVNVNIINKTSTFTGREGNEIQVTKSEVNKVMPYTVEKEVKKPKVEDDENIPF